LWFDRLNQRLEMPVRTRASLLSVQPVEPRVTKGCNEPEIQFDLAG